MFSLVSTRGYALAASGIAFTNFSSLTYPFTHMHARSHAHTHARMHAHAHTHMHTHTRTHTHTCTHTHTHTHTHTACNVPQSTQSRRCHYKTTKPMALYIKSDIHLPTHPHTTNQFFVPDLSVPPNQTQSVCCQAIYALYCVC